jgi:hypothetical protein
MNADTFIKLKEEIKEISETINHRPRDIEDIRLLVERKLQDFLLVVYRKWGEM